MTDRTGLHREMIDLQQLREYETVAVALSDRQARRLDTEASRYLSVASHRDPGMRWVTTREYVGSLVVDDMRILIRPKISLENLFLLLEVQDLCSPGDDRVDDLAVFGYLSAVVEIGEPSQRLVGPVEVVGFVDPVELLERFPSGSQAWMSVEQPVEVCLVGFAEMIRPAQQSETGFGTPPARMLEDADRVSGVVSSGRTRVSPSVN